jgi:hypothetical protein
MKKVTRVETYPRPLVVLATADECVVFAGADAGTLAAAVRRTDECGDDSFVELVDATTSTGYDVLVGDVSDAETGPTVLGIVLSPTGGSSLPSLRVEDALARKLATIYLDARRCGRVLDSLELATDDDRRAAAGELGDDLRLLDVEEEDDPEACPGCGARPGDGLTVGCDDPDGCGYYRGLEPVELVSDDELRGVSAAARRERKRRGR